MPCFLKACLNSVASVMQLATHLRQCAREGARRLLERAALRLCLCQWVEVVLRLKAIADFA